MNVIIFVWRWPLSPVLVATEATEVKAEAMFEAEERCDRKRRWIQISQSKVLFTCCCIILLLLLSRLHWDGSDGVSTERDVASKSLVCMLFCCSASATFPASLGRKWRKLDGSRNGHGTKKKPSAPSVSAFVEFPFVLPYPFPDLCWNGTLLPSPLLVLLSAL